MQKLHEINSSRNLKSNALKGYFPWVQWGLRRAKPLKRRHMAEKWDLIILNFTIIKEIDQGECQIRWGKATTLMIMMMIK